MQIRKYLMSHWIHAFVIHTNAVELRSIRMTIGTALSI